jgi:hypothetical protein
MALQRKRSRLRQDPQTVGSVALYKGEPHSELSVAVTVSPADAQPSEQSAPSIVIQSRPLFARVNSRAEHEQQPQQ